MFVSVVCCQGGLCEVLIIGPESPAECIASLCVI
jgi:hypothetical protein